MTKVFQSKYEHEPLNVEVELFTWEKLDAVDVVRSAFGLDK